MPKTAITPEMQEKLSQQLVAAFKNPQTYAQAATSPHKVEEVTLRETHISWVFLAGDYAYKLKKPVDFGFLNYASLEARRHFCQLELELNQRLAPELYLEVLPVTGSPEQPIIGGEGKAFEYLLKMRRFDDSQVLANLQQKNELTSQHLLQLAEQLASFHESIQGKKVPAGLGTPAAIWEPAAQNFSQIRDFIQQPELLKQLQLLEDWSQDTFTRLEETFAARLQEGFVREGHGDLHLGNATVWQGKVVAFDCIEFNEAFRWCDVISDLAFLIMDLESRGLNAQAHATVNHYLEQTGDYAGLALLNFYKVYRALVRAKVALFRLGQTGLSSAEQAEIFAQYQAYADLASSYTDFQMPYLLITHGFSGSGKSTLTQAVVTELGGIRIRSDVERKRLFGLSPTASSSGQDIYTAEATQHTYARLADLSTQVLKACFAVTLDATNLKLAQRQQLREVAENLGVPCLIISMQATEATLRRRLAKRLTLNAGASEADLQVLEQQLASQEELTLEELSSTIKVDTDAPNASQTLVSLIKSSLKLA